MAGVAGTGDHPGGGGAWTGKEELRDALNLRAAITRSTPCERDVRGRLVSFCDWCARNDGIPS